MRGKRVYRGLLYFFSVLLALLVLAAVLVYPRYGKGLGYFLLLVFPILYLTAGLTSLRTKGWWLLLLAASGGLMSYVYHTTPWAWTGFLPWLAGYLLLGIGSGIAGRGAASGSA